ncbi:MAG: carboxypeptidase-like regulatory domain-containing protein [Candidatus Sericytochromatia bacterium]|nr:carboxypeptidase-like regulatory domain-containing protein [Candidatus Sericytochromatia bacterium]
MIARHRFLPAGTLLLLALAACASPVLPKPRLLNVDEEFAARLTDGTARLIGRARLPLVEASGSRLSEAPAAGATVVLLGTDFKTEISRTTTDSDGNFRIDNVPRGGASILRVTRGGGAETQAIEKLVFPTTSVECVRVDLASSLLVDKIAANGLLKPDPLLSGRTDLLDLVKPDKLAEFEKELRDKLDDLPPSEVAPLLEDALKATDPSAPSPSPPPGDAGAGVVEGTLLDKLGSQDSTVADNYNDIFVKPEEASLTFRISATGYNTGVPRSAQRVSGMVKVSLTGMPQDVTTCELWTIMPDRRQLLTLTGDKGWQGEFDSWSMSSGPTNLDFIGIAPGGKRVLQRLPVIVDNSVSNLCVE